MKSTNLLIPLVFLLSFWIAPYRAHAQMDPTLTTMIVEYTNKAKSQYNNQLEMMSMQTEGHVWLRQEVENTKNCQQQFDTYISTFRGILAFAAQTYGFYHEISRLCDNMGKLTAQIGDTPLNAVAVALHDRRNGLYVDIIQKSIGILNTVRQVCIDSKMTEKQRIELVFSIRPQLQAMNHQLCLLTRLVHCTTMAQVWYGIEYESLPHREGKAGIIEDCLAMWKINAKGVNP